MNKALLRLATLVLFTSLIGASTGARAADGNAGPSAARPGTQAMRSTPGTTFGLIDPRTDDLAAIRGTGLDRVTLNLGWDRFEPVQGQFDAAYAAEVRQQLTDITEAGLGAVLDPGLQYPPPWVFGLGGGARFVNQDGLAWRGPVGADVPDAVFNPAVRLAQRRYLHAVAQVIPGDSLAAIRVGGLWNNELHYPPGRTSTPGANDFWAFSDHALKQSPNPDYRPGAGTATESRAFLRFYLRSLNRYGVWITRVTGRVFGTSTERQVLLPSWGVRPGDQAGAVVSGLDGTSRGELTGALNEGLSWHRLLPRLARLQGTVVPYTTWLDAPDQGDNAVYTSPIRYLVALARPLGLPVAGENTGYGRTDDMERVMGRVRDLDLTSVMWMDHTQMQLPGMATLETYSRLIRSFRATPDDGQERTTSP